MISDIIPLNKNLEVLVELSGDFPEFGLEEIKAILEANNRKPVIISNFGRLVILELGYYDAWLLSWRGAYIKDVAVLIAEEIDDIIETVRRLGENWKIRLSIRTRSKADREYLEKIYEIALTKIPKTHKFSGKLDLVIEKIGEKTCLLLDLGNPRRRLTIRNPKYRSYAPASTMDPYISRGLVNLARTSPGTVFLDPFAGSGSIAIEASSIGAFTIASDLSAKHLLGLELNRRALNLDIKIVLADATKLPMEENSVDAIATDPPYGRSASTFKRGLKKLYLEFLREAQRVMKEGKYIAFCAPADMEIESEIGDFGYKIVSKLIMRVHRSLSRTIRVLTF